MGKMKDCVSQVSMKTDKKLDYFAMIEGLTRVAKILLGFIFIFLSIPKERL